MVRVALTFTRKNFNALRRVWWVRESLKPLNLFFSKTWFCSNCFSKIYGSIVGVSQKSVSRIIKLQDATGFVTPKRKGKCGRKRKTTPKDDLILVRNSKKDSRKTSFDLQKDLESAGVRISSSTVRRRLLEADRKAKKPLKKNLLTKRMKKKRLHWAKAHKTWTIKTGRKHCLRRKVIFSFKESTANWSGSAWVNN